MLATVVALTMLFWFRPSPAFAASCNPGRSPHDNNARYAHTEGPVTSLTALSSYITEYDPYYSGSNGTGTNATIMMVRFSPALHWSQLGWFKSKIDGGVTKRESGFEFYISASQNYFRWFGSEPVNNTTKYEITYESPSTWSFFRNGSLLATMTYSWTATDYQVFGETHDWVDQMPGDTSHPVQFGSTTYYTGSTYTAHTVTSAITTQSPYGVWNPNPGQYFIWDGGCP